MWDNVGGVEIPSPLEFFPNRSLLSGIYDAIKHSTVQRAPRWKREDPTISYYIAMADSMNQSTAAAAEVHATATSTVRAGAVAAVVALAASMGFERLIPALAGALAEGGWEWLLEASPSRQERHLRDLSTYGWETSP
jgi:hypothetical protein